MKPQDCLILLKIISLGSSPWMAKDLAANLDLSPTEVSMSLDRSRFAGLLDNGKRRVNTGLFLDFLVHGLKVVFPVQLGGLTRGIPAAWSAPPLSELISSSEMIVWPFEEGNARGESLFPLYGTAVISSLRSPALGELLALTDALRIGRRREIDLSARILKERFDAYLI